MSRSYVTFDDIAGRLDSLNIECGRCPRKGRYHVEKLIEKYGRLAPAMSAGFLSLPIRATSRQADDPSRNPGNERSATTEQR
jgi:hypothetical protein